MVKTIYRNFSNRPHFLEKHTPKEIPKLREIEIINRSKEDIKHFRPLYESYFNAILNYVYQKVSDKEVANDITSYVFLKAMTNLNSYKIQSVPFSAWLYKIAFNETMLYFRKSKKMRTISLDDQLIEGMQQEMDAFSMESILKMIEEELGNLSSIEIEIIELRFYQNKSFREIGYILGCTENTAKVKSHRLIKKLKTELSKRNCHEEL